MYAYRPGGPPRLRIVDPFSSHPLLIALTPHHCLSMLLSIYFRALPDVLYRCSILDLITYSTIDTRQAWFSSCKLREVRIRIC
jgi:hypothetical protein